MPENSRLWRYVALVSVVLNIFINIAYPKFTDNITIEMVTSWYHSLFTPDGFTFAIWGLIFLLFSIYAIAQLLPSQRYISIYDELAFPFIWANLASGVWVMVFTGNLISLSMVVIFTCLTAAILLFVKTNKAIRKEQASKWVLIPFSIFLGWITVAAISNVAIWLVSLGWQGSGIGEPPITIALIIITGIMACIISRFYNNYLLLLTIAWGFLGIFSANRIDYQQVATVALISAIVTGLYGIVQVFQSIAVVGSRRLNTI